MEVETTWTWIGCKQVSCWSAGCHKSELVAGSMHPGPSVLYEQAERNGSMQYESIEAGSFGITRSWLLESILLAPAVARWP